MTKNVSVFARNFLALAAWLASSQESALRGIRTVVAQVVTDMKTNRETIPEPLPHMTFNFSCSSHMFFILDV